MEIVRSIRVGGTTNRRKVNIHKASLNALTHFADWISPIGQLLGCNKENMGMKSWFLSTYKGDSKRRFLNYFHSENTILLILSYKNSWCQLSSFWPYKIFCNRPYFGQGESRNGFYRKYIGPPGLLMSNNRFIILSSK